MDVNQTKLDRIVLESLRERGQSMSAAEVAYEVGVTVDAAERSLDRLCDQLVVRHGFGSGGYYAVEPPRQALVDLDAYPGAGSVPCQVCGAAAGQQCFIYAGETFIDGGESARWIHKERGEGQ